MYKVRPGSIAAATFKYILKETIEKFLAGQNEFSFINSVKETPAYWKQFLFDILVIVKQLGIPIYFLTLSCAKIGRPKMGRTSIYY